MSQTHSGPIDLEPDAVQDLMQRGEIVLVDVREPQEHAAERIPGAVSMPLSAFDPAALPGGDPSRVVFHCGIGKRSAMAVERAVQAGVPVHRHLRGGLNAWKAAGLPTEQG